MLSAVFTRDSALCGSSSNCCTPTVLLRSVTNIQGFKVAVIGTSSQLRPTSSFLS